MNPCRLLRGNLSSIQLPSQLQLVTLGETTRVLKKIHSEDPLKHSRQSERAGTETENGLPSGLPGLRMPLKNKLLSIPGDYHIMIGDMSHQKINYWLRLLTTISSEATVSEVPLNLNLYAVISKMCKAAVIVSLLA